MKLMRGARFALRPDAGQEAALTDLGIARRLAYNSALELIEEVYGFSAGSDPQISETLAGAGRYPWRYLDSFTLNNIGNALRHCGAYGSPDRIPTTVVEEAIVDACRAHKHWVDHLGKPGRKIGRPTPVPYGDDLTFRIRKGAAAALATKDTIKLPGISTPVAVAGLTRWLTRQLSVSDGRVRQITLKREAGVWYASLVVEREQIEPDQIKDASDLDLPVVSDQDCGRSFIPFELRADVVGGDLGLTTLLTLSDGTQIANPRFLGRSRRRLRALNKAVARAERRRYTECWRLAVAHDPLKWAKEAEILKARSDGRGLPVPPAYWRAQVPRSQNLLALLSKLGRLHAHIRCQRESYGLLVAADMPVATPFWGWRPSTSLG